MDNIQKNKVTKDELKYFLCDKSLFKIESRSDIQGVLKNINHSVFSNLRKIENNLSYLHHYMEYLNDDELLFMESLQETICSLNNIKELHFLNEEYKDASLMRNVSTIYDVSILFNNISLLLLNREINYPKTGSNNFDFDFEQKLKTYFFNEKYNKCLRFIKKTEDTLVNDRDKVLCVKFKFYCLYKLNKNKEKQKVFIMLLNIVNDDYFYFDELFFENLDSDTLKILKKYLSNNFYEVIKLKYKYSEARLNQIKRAKEIRKLLE